MVILKQALVVHWLVISGLVAAQHSRASGVLDGASGVLDGASWYAVRNESCQEFCLQNS